MQSHVTPADPLDLNVRPGTTLHELAYLGLNR